MAKKKQEIQDDQYLTMTAQDNYEDEEEVELLSLEDEFKERYADEFDSFQKYKLWQEEETKRKLSKKPMKELVEYSYQQKQKELLSTDALGSVAIVMGGKNFGKMEDARVLDDNKLETMVAGKKKEVAILHEPVMMTINMRKYWAAGGLAWKIRYFFVWMAMRATFMMDVGILRFNVFFLRGDGEYTIDPSKDWTPWELQRKLEGFLKLEGRMLKANIKAQMIKDQSDEKRFNNLVFAFLIWSAVIIFMFVWASGGQ